MHHISQSKNSFNCERYVVILSWLDREVCLKIWISSRGCCLRKTPNNKWDWFVWNGGEGDRKLLFPFLDNDAMKPPRRRDIISLVFTFKLLKVGFLQLTQSVYGYQVRSLQIGKQAWNESDVIFNITEGGLELIFFVLEGGYCLSFC